MNYGIKEVFEVKLVDTKTGEEVAIADCTNLTINQERESHSFGHGKPIMMHPWKREVKVSIEMKDVSISNPDFLHQMAVKFLVVEYWNKRITINEFMDKCDILRELFEGFKKGENQ